MKTIFIICIIIFCSCNQIARTKHNGGSERIKTVEVYRDNGVSVSILEIDGKEYLVNYRGGIIAIE